MTAEIAQASLRRLAGRGGGGDDQVKGNEDRGVKKLHPNIWLWPLAMATN